MTQKIDGRFNDIYEIIRHSLAWQFELISQFVASRIITMSLNLLVYFIIRWLCRRVELYVTTYISTLPVPSVNISLNYCKMGTNGKDKFI